MECIQINQLQTPNSGAVSYPHVWTTLHWMTGRRWDCNVWMRCQLDKRRIPFGQFQLSIHLKSPGSLTRRQALNVHFKTAPFRKDAELLWFAQTYYECGSLHRIYIWISRRLRGAHLDTSAASIWKLRQWRSQQPSCLDYVVLDDRSPVIDCPPCVRNTGFHIRIHFFFHNVRVPPS